MVRTESKSKAAENHDSISKGTIQKVPGGGVSKKKKKVKPIPLNLDTPEGQRLLKEIREQGELSAPSTSTESTNMAEANAGVSSAVHNVAHAGGQGENSQAVSLIRNPTTQNNCVHFYKTFIIKSYSFQSVSGIEYKSGSLLTTPMVCLPVWDLQLYLNYQEWVNLPPLSYCKALSVEVKPLYSCTPFPTGEVSSGFANSHQGSTIMYSIGLNQKCPMAAVQYEAEVSNSTKPTAAKDYSCAATDVRLYGAQGSISMCIPRHINCYTGILQEHDNADRWSPDLSSLITLAPLQDLMGETIIHYKYAPREGILQGQDNIQDKNTFLKSMSFGTNVKGSLINPNLSEPYQSIDESIGSVAIPRQKAGTYPSYNMVDNGEVTWRTPIEKCMYITPGLDAHLTTKDQPTIHFGVQPTMNNLFTSAVKSFTPMTCYWEIKTNIEVDFIYHSRNQVKREFAYGHEKYWLGKTSDPDIKDFIQGNPDGVAWVKGRRLGKVMTMPKNLQESTLPRVGRDVKNTEEATFIRKQRSDATPELFSSEETEPPKKTKRFGFI